MFLCETRFLVGSWLVSSAQLQLAAKESEDRGAPRQHIRLQIHAKAQGAAFLPMAKAASAGLDGELIHRSSACAGGGGGVGRHRGHAAFEQAKARERTGADAQIGRLASTDAQH